MDSGNNSTADVFLCTSNEDCFNHGICTESKCICYTLWTGSQCETNKVDASEATVKFFWIQNAICAALFLGIAVAAIVQLKFMADQKKIINRNNFANWLLFILIAFIGFERVLYLMLDPYRYRGIIGAVAEAILFGLATWGFVCIYLIILVIWIKMYTSAKNAEQFLSKLIKYIFMLMALVLGVQLIYDIIRAIDD